MLKSFLICLFVFLTLSACTRVSERPSIEVSGSFYWNDIITLSYAQPFQAGIFPDISLNGKALPKSAILANNENSISFPLAILEKPQPKTLSVELSYEGKALKLRLGNQISSKLIYSPRGIANAGRINVLLRCNAFEDSVSQPDVPEGPRLPEAAEGFSIIDYFGNAGSLYHPELGQSQHPDPWCLMVLGFSAESTEQAIKNLKSKFNQAGIEIVALAPDYYIYGNDPGGHSFDTDCSQQGRLALEAAKSQQISEDNLRSIVGAGSSSLTGKGITVALIDGGVAEPQSFLTASPEAHFSRRFTGIDYLSPDPGALNIEDDFDCSNTPFFDGHGSLVARIVHKLAPDANLIALKACNSDGLCSTSSIAKALLYLRNNYQGFPKVDIINMSFGGPLESNPVFEYLLKDLISDKNILFVASSGNNPDDSAHYPAQYQTLFPNVVATAALKQAKTDSPWQLASFNTKMVLFSKLDGLPIGAPGVAIKLEGLGSPSGITGTSFAAPVLTGVAALALEQNRDFQGQLLLKRLEAAAQPLAEARLIQLP